MDYLKEVNEKFPIRKTDEQKSAFRQYVLEKAQEKGVNAKVECLNKHNNVIIGNPSTAKAVFTAHYDTPCASLFPNLMTPRNKGLFYLYQSAIIFIFLAIALTPAIIIGMGILQSELAYAGIFLTLYFGLFILCFKAFTNKHNANDNTSGVATLLSIMDKLDGGKLQEIAFILFDDEEKGLLGSKAYAKAHKTEMQDKLLINFDCVGNGKEILFIAKPKAEENAYFAPFQKSFKSNQEFSVAFYSQKGSVANSDYKKFEQGVCCVACKKGKNGLLYTPYIHTGKDVVADGNNIEYLAQSTVNFIESIV